MPNQIATLDWNDTFLNVDHLNASFPDSKVLIKDEDESKPPFR